MGAKDHITKQETTVIKIEMAAEIAKENKRREAYNVSRAVRNGNADELPMLRPSWQPVRNYKRPHSIRSNKYLCGSLSILCDVMREAGLPYPWRAQ